MKNSCLHCGLETKNQEEKFCCNGCNSAYKIINNLGLKSYYQNRFLNKKIKTLKPEENIQIDISEFITREENTYSINLMIEGLHCAACVWLIESVLNKRPEVKKARVNMSTKRLYLEWFGNVENGNQLVKSIFDLGYRLVPFDAELLKAEQKKYDSSILKALAVAGFASGNVMMISVALWASDSLQMGVATRNLLYWISSLITLPAIVYSGRIFIASAFNSIKARRTNMDVPISVAIILASIISIFEAINKGEHAYFDSVIMLIFFLLIGRYLDFCARKKAFSITSDLIILSGTSATILENKKQRIIANKDLRKEMILIVAMGEKIAADGVIIQGITEIDTAVITGESMPKKCQIGDEVFAGMVNLGNTIQIRITKAKEETLLAKIVLMVQNIENSKNYYTNISDVVAKYYTPIIHILALGTFLFWYFGSLIGWHQALLNAAAVLIITCPCALALAMPVVQIVAVGRLLKQGIFLKNGEVLEKINKIDTIIFDKTGTLTLGKPVLLTQNIDPKILQLAASMASKSRHILSKSLTESFKGELLNLEVVEVAGMGLTSIFDGEEIRLGNKKHCNYKGLEADNNLPEIYFTHNNQTTIFTFQDQLKPDAKSIVGQLKNDYQNVILLSGDKEFVVKSAAKELGIEEYYFEKTPDQKLEIVDQLKVRNKNILMIGDGINDAPSLMKANVSASPAIAADITKNIADIIFQGKNLQPILEVLLVAKKSNLLIKQNLLLALVYNVVAVPFAILGFVVPLFAALAMSISSIFVVLNALRIRKKI